MKLQHITKLISKNITAISIASAFVLGAVGMSDMSGKLFDTSAWFKAEETTTNSVEAVEVVATEAPETVVVIEATTEKETVPSVTETKEAVTEATTEATTEITTEATTEATETTKETTVVSETTSAKVTEPQETTAAPTTAAPTTEAPTETSVPETTAPLGDMSGTYCDDIAKAVLDYVNAERAANGLAPLSWNNTLTDAAKIRASEIVVCWSHTRPDGSPWYTAGAKTQLGENLAFGQSTAEEVVAAWMNSQSHKDNILDARYTKLGVSCYYCNGQYYWAQEFA